jgi:drug/metabolite transporter (DMT)-like permease
MAPPAARGAGVLLRRTVVTIVGVALVVVGVVLLVLPGPGLLLVLAGLIVLANEYPWAQRYVAPVRRQAITAAQFSVASNLRIAWTAAVGLALIIAGIVWINVPTLPFGGAGTGSSLILSGVILLGLLGYSVHRWGGGRGTAAQEPSRRRVV